MNGKRMPPLDPSFILSRLTVDVENGKTYWVDATKYHKNLIGKEAGCLARFGGGKYYHVISINGFLYKRASIIFAIKTGRWALDQIDHIDGDSTNDRGDNLRECNNMQNQWNIKRKRKVSALPMGVTQTQNGKYQARIKVAKVSFVLGTFFTVRAAQDAYIAARKKHFGEFA